MGKYKSEKEDLQDFVSVIFGKKNEIKNRASKMRSNIYIGGIGLSLSIIALAILLLNFTG
jgi:hypothetical protein